jgi:hypothetical protein
MESEWAGIEKTFDLVESIMDGILTDVDFMDESLNDILEG